MATLNGSTLRIELIGGTNRAKVTTSVNVGLTELERALIGLGLRFRLECRLRGEDGGFNGSDDDLVFIEPHRTITSPGTQSYTFEIDRKYLDEDNGTDEVYAFFRLVSRESLFSLNLTHTSPVVSAGF